ncbi:MAG: recombination mediator RecR [Phycisphaerales bacterium]|nr:recombination mediator RecR [Phycisphaerales bacterium]
MQGSPLIARRPNEPGPYPEAVNRLIQAFASLPGIGRRTAERLAFHVLKSPSDEALRLAHAVTDVKKNVRHCSICYNLTDADPCPICADPRRDAATILVVEQPRDLIALEQTGMYRGVYHVLMGRLDPLAGVGPRDITLEALLHRVDDPASNARGEAVREVILGLNPDLEGDGTAMHIAEDLRRRGVAVSRLARGLPTGSQLEYANRAVLGDAIQGRQQMP